ncbi:MAG: NHLP bacteriocin export ABC transporter permease/ATPase subunit, partial [Thermosynechococcaceae cyanobacterium]
SAVLQMGLGLGTAAKASTLFQLVQNFATLRLEAIADARSQAALWDHLLKLKLAFFRQYSTGDLQSRVSAIRHIRQILSGATLRTLISSLIAFLNLGLLFVYNASLAGIALAITLVVMVLTFAGSTLSRRYLRRLQELQGASFGFMVQLIGGIAKLRVATAETRAFARWASGYREQLTLFRYSQRIEDSILLANSLVPTLSNAIIFTVAVGLLQAPATPFGPPAFSSGSFLAFHAAFGLLLAGATDLSNTLVHALDVSILWERSQPILRAAPEVDENTTDPGRLSGAVVLDHISFRYRDDGAMVLNDICLEAKPGDFIALVGPSGSGKSTLMRLLLGFEQPTSGRIFYDGQDLAGLDVGAVRRQLGVVLQNGKINAATLYENIAGTALVTLDEAMDAARMAGLAEDIAAMPMGMHTVISEGGSNLSGGQRQRLLIARALALNPKILFFDEATSALDNRTQDIVTQSLDQLNVTRIVIAHRLSTIRTADCIYVLSGGRMVQSGTFEQLAHQTGLFAQLIARQTL